MHLGKIAIFAALLASCAPAALATPVAGDLAGAGRGIITSTGFTLTNSSKTGTKSPKGVVLGDGTGSFSVFTDLTPFFFAFNNPNYHFNFASASATTPVKLFTITESGSTLVFFLTNVDPGVVAASPGKTGSFSGEGFVTLTGFTQSNVTFQLTNSGDGGSAVKDKAFSFDITAHAPEPSGLVLLGTGALGAAGMMIRRFRSL